MTERTAGAPRRWAWVNGFCTAALETILWESDRPPSRELTYAQACEAYLSAVERRYRDYGCPELPPLQSVSPVEIRYLFHLESELWGADWQEYVTFFPSREEKPVWQTFHFALAFYLVERWLYLFMPPEQRREGRGKRRRYLFGVENGLFSHKYQAVLSVLGLPFSLRGSTKSVDAVDDDSRCRWKELRRCSMPVELLNFYQSVTGYDHCCMIVEAAFKRTREYLPQLLKRKHLGRGVYAWWYDLLWRYSESVRYRPLDVDYQVDAWYWNRTVRWLASLLTSGMMWIATRRTDEQPISNLWKQTTGENPIISGVYGGWARSVIPEA